MGIFWITEDQRLKECQQEGHSTTRSDLETPPIRISIPWTGLEFFRSLIHPVSVCIFSRCLWLGPLSAPSSSGHSHARGGTAGRKNVAWILVLTPAAPQPGARCNLLNFLTLQPAASSRFCVFLSLELLASWSLLRLELLLIYSLSSRVPLVFRWESL